MDFEQSYTLCLSKLLVSSVLSKSSFLRAFACMHIWHASDTLLYGRKPFLGNGWFGVCSSKSGTCHCLNAVFCYSTESVFDAYFNN